MRRSTNPYTGKAEPVFDDDSLFTFEDGLFVFRSGTPGKQRIHKVDDEQTISEAYNESYGQNDFTIGPDSDSVSFGRVKDRIERNNQELHIPKNGLKRNNSFSSLPSESLYDDDSRKFIDDMFTFNSSMLTPETYTSGYFDIRKDDDIDLNTYKEYLSASTNPKLLRNPLELSKASRRSRDHTRPKSGSRFSKSQSRMTNSFSTLTTQEIPEEFEHNVHCSFDSSYLNSMTPRPMLTARAKEFDKKFESDSHSNTRRTLRKSPSKTNDDVPGRNFHTDKRIIPRPIPTSNERKSDEYERKPRRTLRKPSSSATAKIADQRIHSQSNDIQESPKGSYPFDSVSNSKSRDSHHKNRGHDMGSASRSHSSYSSGRRDMHRIPKNVTHKPAMGNCPFDSVSSYKSHDSHPHNRDNDLSCGTRSRTSYSRTSQEQSEPKNIVKKMTMGRSAFDKVLPHKPHDSYQDNRDHDLGSANRSHSSYSSGSRDIYRRPKNSIQKPPTGNYPFGSVSPYKPQDLHQDNRDHDLGSAARSRSSHSSASTGSKTALQIAEELRALRTKRRSRPIKRYSPSNKIIHDDYKSFLDSSSAKSNHTPETYSKSSLSRDRSSAYDRSVKSHDHFGRKEEEEQIEVGSFNDYLRTSLGTLGKKR